MDKDTLHLWCAYPDDLRDEEAAQACIRLLSDEERARCQRFKFEKNRREYLATHALERIALSHHSGIAPDALRFRFNAYGKPAIDPDCGLRFNLSNSLSLVVCLISEGAEVGVDVESHARAASIAEVGPRMFSPEELAQLEADLAAKRFTLRIQHAVGQVENTAEIRKTRRELARVKTALKFKLAQ